MMMKDAKCRPRRTATVILILFMSITALNTVSPSSVADEIGASRTVVLEVVTSTFCVGCPSADAAADMLSVDFGPERLSVLQYHVSFSDPFRTPETDERGYAYDMGETGLPAAWFDGTESVISVTEPSVDKFYDLFRNKIDNRLSNRSPITILLSLTESSGNLTVNATFDKPTPATLPGSLISRYVLYENLVEHDSHIYNYVVRDIEERTFEESNLRYSEDVVFQLNGSWNSSRLGVVVFVQVGDNGEIIQSSNSVLGPQPVVTVTTDVDGEELSGTVRIEGTASGDVESVEVRIDNQLYETAEGTSSWYFDIDTSKLSRGDHSLTVRAYSDSMVYSDANWVWFSVEESLTDLILYIIIIVVIVVVVLIAGVALRSRRKRGEEEPPTNSFDTED